ncbi:hypothetical protein ACLOJK_028896 [Asimina triloba]
MEQNWLSLVIRSKLVSGAVTVVEEADNQLSVEDLSKGHWLMVPDRGSDTGSEVHLLMGDGVVE